jgi:hypothetical protein
MLAINFTVPERKRSTAQGSKSDNVSREMARDELERDDSAETVVIQAAVVVAEPRLRVGAGDSDSVLTQKAQERLSGNPALGRRSSSATSAPGLNQVDSETNAYLILQRLVVMPV